jgi:rSAM/selenodomain-associated transferase 1
MAASQAHPADRIILFLKSFQPGRVKTRLAARIGHRGALEIYTAMVADLLARLEPVRNLLIPYFDALPSRHDRPLGYPPSISSLLSRGLLRVQQGEELGERMSRAFQEVFAAGAERVVLIGSDIPRIGSELLEGYLSALRRLPMVLGPAADGGYYLIGFRRERFEPSVFAGIEWSTERVLDQTLDKARSCGLPCHVGAELQDVDTLEDLESLLSAGLPAGSLAGVLEQYLVQAET